ncbi:MAG TPA: helical backbone metal receptor [Flavobacteriales bacterium]|nr:helical backbone metal receptor [Flavobacteriales bacterium]
MKIKKIISLVPSQSELLWDLGLREELAGITKFCIHPHEMFRSVTRIGGTKTLNIEKIRALRPDLIIANKEENEREQVEVLQKEFNVHVTEVYTLEDAYAMIAEVGEMVGKKEKANELVDAIRIEFARLSTPQNLKRVVYFIWKNPYMVAGKHTIIDNLLMHAGFENAVKTARYPEMTSEQVNALKPDCIFLSSEPFPFSEKHKAEFGFMPMKNIKIVDGEMFSWYGSRLLKAPAYFKAFAATV